MLKIKLLHLILIAPLSFFFCIVVPVGHALGGTYPGRPYTFTVVGVLIVLILLWINGMRMVSGGKVKKIIFISLGTVFLLIPLCLFSINILQGNFN